MQSMQGLLEAACPERPLRIISIESEQLIIAPAVLPLTDKRLEEEKRGAQIIN